MQQPGVISGKSLFGQALCRRLALDFFPEYLPVPEMEYAIGPIDDPGIMGGKEEGRVFLPVDLGEEVNEGQAGLRVEACRRLVGKDNQWIRHDGTGHGNSLLLPAGQVSCPVVHEVGKTNGRKGPFHHFFSLPGRNIEQGEDILNILKCGENRDKIKPLKNEADVLPPEQRGSGPAEAACFPAVDDDLAAGGGVKRSREVEQGAFPGSGRPGNADEISFLDAEIDVPQGRDGKGCMPICFAEIAQFNYRHGGQV